MKGVGTFVLGFIAGIVVTIIVVANMDYDTNVPSEPSEPSDGLYGLTIFPKKGECIETNELEVSQVIKPNIALAYTDMWHDMITVLLINYDGKSISYYDDQIIKIPSGKCVRHIGTYQYRSGIVDHTVPAVIIE